MNKKPTIKTYLLLHTAIFILALGTICSKNAASQEFLSAKFVMYYGLFIGTLGIYAIIWQQVLKKMPLVTAFCNKSMTIIWGLIFGLLFFGEAITVTKILGAIVVITGVIRVVTADEK